MNEIYTKFINDFGFDLPETSYDFEQLKNTGIVEESEVVDNGFITKVFKYTSHDGNTQITQQICYSKNYLLGKENRELRKQIQEAVAVENYELAAELKNKLRKK